MSPAKGHETRASHAHRAPAHGTVVAPKPVSGGSWWAETTAQDFREVARREQARMTQTSQNVNYQTTSGMEAQNRRGTE